MGCEISVELRKPQGDIVTIHMEVQTHCDSKTEKKKERQIILLPKTFTEAKEIRTDKSVVWRLNLYAKKKIV